jgi:hypothetical protein
MSPSGSLSRYHSSSHLSKHSLQNLAFPFPLQCLGSMFGYEAARPWQRRLLILLEIVTQLMLSRHLCADYGTAACSREFAI